MSGYFEWALLLNLLIIISDGFSKQCYVETIIAHCILKQWGFVKSQVRGFSRLPLHFLWQQRELMYDVLCTEDNPASSEERNETAWTQHSCCKNSLGINLWEGVGAIWTENALTIQKNSLKMSFYWDLGCLVCLLQIRSCWGRCERFREDACVYF